MPCVHKTDPASHREGAGALMKDVRNMKEAPNPFTEHICCIVNANYILFCFFSNKVQASTIQTDFLCKNGFLDKENCSLSSVDQLIQQLVL